MVFFIDLGMIVTGSIDDLCSYRGPFAVMSTNGIYCESAQDGYNSSIMLFNSDSARILYDTLCKHYDYLLRFLMRFDHYLEMLVWNADYVQDIAPG